MSFTGVERGVSVLLPNGRMFLSSFKKNDIYLPKSIKTHTRIGVAFFEATHESPSLLSLSRLQLQLSSAVIYDVVAVVQDHAISC